MLPSRGRGRIGSNPKNQDSELISRMMSGDLYHGTWNILHSIHNLSLHHLQLGIKQKVDAQDYTGGEP